MEYARQEQHEEALKFYDKAIEIDSREFLPWVNKSVSLRKLGRIDDALQYLEAALAKVSDQTEVLISLAGLFADDRSDDERALKYYQLALETKPEELRIKAGMAECLIKSGRYREGRAYALEVGRASKDANLQCVVQYLMVVSYVLEGADTGMEFRKFIEHFRGQSEKSIADSTDWNYRGVKNTINKSDVAPESKFLLLTFIDLLLGKIDASKLSFFESPTAGVSTPPRSAGPVLAA